MIFENLTSYTKMIFYNRPKIRRIILPKLRDDSRLDHCNWSITDILSVLLRKKQAFQGLNYGKYFLKKKQF